MKHQRRINPCERAALEHQDLPAPALLGRRPQHEHLPSKSGCHRRQAYTGAQRGRADQIVAAGMPDLGEGIVLRQECNSGPARSGSDFGPECRGQVGDAALHRKPVLFQRVGQPLRSLHFLERDLRRRMNPAAEINQFFRRAVNGLQNRLTHRLCLTSLTLTLPTGEGYGELNYSKRTRTNRRLPTRSTIPSFKTTSASAWWTRSPSTLTPPCEIKRFASLFDSARPVSTSSLISRTRPCLTSSRPTTASGISAGMSFSTNTRSNARSAAAALVFPCHIATISRASRALASRGWTLPCSNPMAMAPTSSMGTSLQNSQQGTISASDR